MSPATPGNLWNQVKPLPSALELAQTLLTWSHSLVPDTKAERDDDLTNDY